MSSATIVNIRSRCVYETSRCRFFDALAACQAVTFCSLFRADALLALSPCHLPPPSAGPSPALCPRCCTYGTDSDSLCQPPCLEPCQTPRCPAPPPYSCLWVQQMHSHTHSLAHTDTLGWSHSHVKFGAKFTQPLLAFHIFSWALLLPWKWLFNA